MVSGRNIMAALLWAAGVLAPLAGAEKPVVALGRAVEVEDLENRRYTGLVVAPAVVQIVPRVSGEILEVGFSDGSVVKAGQMLYKLDPVQYEAAVKSAEAKVAKSKAELEYAQTNFDRQQTLFDKNAISRDTMENVRSALAVRKAELMAAESELIAAQDNLKNTTIISPITGLAGLTAYTAGNYITPGSGVLVTIVKVQPMRVRFSLSTADLTTMFDSMDNLLHDAVVRLTLPNGKDYPTAGKIEFVNNQANIRTDAVQLFATFPNQDYRLLNGSTVRVMLSRRRGVKRPAVPPSAVMHDARGAYVYVVDSRNIPARRDVVLGNSTPEFQMIASGLKPGETVVVKGTHKVIPGSEVEPAAE